MTVDIEERLRADLPRLADVLADRPDAPVYEPAPDRSTRRRAGLAAVAAAVVVALTVGVVALVDRDGTDTRRIRTTPAQTTAQGWTALARSGLGARENVATVWTGSEVLVWGGNVGNLFLQSGAAYDPATGTWRALTPNRWAGPGTMSTWTGDRLVVVAKRSGAAYTAATDTWTELPYLPDGVNSGFAGVVWSGADVFGAVWGGGELRVARLDEPRGRWTLGATQAADAGDEPAASGSGWAIPSVATWFDGEVFVWVGDRGWAYRPDADTWRTLPEVPDAGSAASDLAVVGDRLLAVVAGDGADGRTVRVLRLDGGDWTPLVETAAPDFAVPVAQGHGRDLYVVDATGVGTPLRIDVDADAVTRLDGVPGGFSLGTSATWAGDGLFVWGGLGDGDPEAAWYRPE